MAYTKRLHLKGVPFLGFRYMKGKGFHYVKGVPLLSIESIQKGNHFLPEMACNQDKGLVYESEPPPCIKLC